MRCRCIVTTVGRHRNQQAAVAPHLATPVYITAGQPEYRSPDPLCRPTAWSADYWLVCWQLTGESTAGGESAPLLFCLSRSVEVQGRAGDFTSSWDFIQQRLLFTNNHFSIPVNCSHCGTERRKQHNNYNSSIRKSQ